MELPHDTNFIFRKRTAGRIRLAERPPHGRRSHPTRPHGAGRHLLPPKTPWRRQVTAKPAVAEQWRRRQSPHGAATRLPTATTRGENCGQQDGRPVEPQHPPGMEIYEL